MARSVLLARLCPGQPEDEESEVPMIAMDNRASWWSRAACATADPELFFPISDSGPALRQVRQAKAVCARCQIQRECLRYALEAGPIQGVWGGMTEQERGGLLRRGRRMRAGPLAGGVGVDLCVPEAARSR